jgi:hypothetical protein
MRVLKAASGKTAAAFFVYGVPAANSSESP